MYKNSLTQIMVLISVIFLFSCKNSRIASSKEVMNNFRVNFVLVKMGSYTRTLNTNPPKKQIIKITKDYWIAKTEVTQAQYKAIIHSLPKDLSWENRGENKPVFWVTWFQVTNFCKRFTELERKAGRLPKGYEYRLPTVAEWEFAARGGNRSKKYSRYSGSNNIDEVAWYAKNSNGVVHSVGLKKANELGIYDMSGNVYEWCYDWAGKKNNNPILIDPKGAVMPFYSMKNIRGGCFNEQEIKVKKQFIGLAKMKSLGINIRRDKDFICKKLPFPTGFRPVLAPVIDDGR